VVIIFTFNSKAGRTLVSLSAPLYLMPLGIVSHNDKCVTPHIYSYSELAHFKITMQTLSVTYDGLFWIYGRVYNKCSKVWFCGSWHAGNAGSHPAGAIQVCLV